MKTFRRLPLLVLVLIALPIVPARADETADRAAVRASIDALPAGADAPAVNRRGIETLRPQLLSLYAPEQPSLQWSRHGVLTAQARTLLLTMAGADAYGLEPTDYNADGLLRSIPDASAHADAPALATQMAALDVRLSLAALSFVNDLATGRIEARAGGFEVPHSMHPAFDAAGALERIAASDNVVADVDRLQPDSGHYRLLMAALQRYRSLLTDATLTQLPPLPGPKLVPGAQYAGAAQLRRLLVALGDMPESAPVSADDKLGGALLKGLRHFQARHGLSADGTLGAATYDALTMPLQERVHQIEINLDRLRWLPPLDPPSILVNIPAFRLFARDTDHKQGSELLKMDVVVGRDLQTPAQHSAEDAAENESDEPDTRTPSFAATLRTVVFHPYWNIPTSILKHEMLKRIRVGGNYLERLGIEIVRGDGEQTKVLPLTAETLKGLRNGSLRLRQKPGGHNSLGLVKFLFPNTHNVYMHSTPAVRLFKLPRRAYSHGCVRLSDPVALAEWVLRGAPGDWTRDKIEAAMNADVQSSVQLTRPIRVALVYMTAIAEEDGTMHFYEDIYGHDAEMRKLLNGLPAGDNHQ